MSENALEAQVESLSGRLAKAEDSIGKLLTIVESLKSELLSQKKVISRLTGRDDRPPAAEFGSSACSERSMFNSVENNVGTVTSMSSNPTGANGILEEAWEFNDNMDIDWDDLGILDEVSTKSQPPAETALREQHSLTLTPPADTTLGTIATHKHARDEPSEAELNEFSSNIKAMRYDSLDRILGYTVQASAVSDKNLIKIDADVNYDEERKATSGKIIRYMNGGDMNALSKLVSEYFCDSLVMYYCQIADTIHGKAEAMMLFSLLYESYPDGVWKITSTEVQGKVVTHQFLFTGTSVFDTPLAVSYHQVKEHQRGMKSPEVSEESAAQQIVRNVAEYNPRSGDVSASTSLASIHHAIHSTNGSFSFRPSSIGHGLKSDLDLSNLNFYDRLNSPRSSDCETPVAGTSTTAAVTDVLSVPASAGANATAMMDSDVIKIPRSKGNESFRLDGHRAPSFTLGSGDRKLDLKHTSLPHKPPSINSELLTNALLRRTNEVERRRMEVTFNEYNLIVQIVISAVAK